MDLGNKTSQIDYTVNVKNSVLLVRPSADISAIGSVAFEKRQNSEQEEREMREAEHMLSWTCNRDKAARLLGEEVIQKVVPTEVYVPSETQLNQLIGHCQAEHEHIMKKTICERKDTAKHLNKWDWEKELWQASVWKVEEQLRPPNDPHRSP